MITTQCFSAHFSCLWCVLCLHASSFIVDQTSVPICTEPCKVWSELWCQRQGTISATAAYSKWCSKLKKLMFSMVFKSPMDTNEMKCNNQCSVLIGWSS